MKNTEEVMFLKTNRAFFIEQIENNKNFDFVIWAMTNIDEKNLTEDLTNLYKNIISNQEQISQQFRDAIQDEHENSINELLEKNKALCSVLKYLNPSTVNEPKCKMGSSL
jgi:mevalonate kinase